MLRWKTFKPKKVLLTDDPRKQAPLVALDLPELIEGLMPRAERFYFIANDNNPSETRGGHYHLASSEILLCARGSASVEIHSKDECSVVTINPDNAIFIPQLCWHAVEIKTDSILVAIAEKTEKRTATARETLNDCNCGLCGNLFSCKKEIALAIKQKI